MSYLFRTPSIYRQNQRKIFNKIKGYLTDKFESQAINDAVSGRNIQEHDRFQYPVKYENQDKIEPQSLEQENQVLEENEKKVSNLEKARMEKLDEIYQTNTFFHPINEVFEERIDSETVMTKSRALRKYLREKGQTSFIDFDIQEKIDLPQVRSWQQYYKALSEINFAPKHPKIASVKTNKFETIIDNYEYLDEKSIADPNQRLDIDSPEFNNIYSFVSKECIHTDMGLFQNYKLEDTIINELRSKMVTNNRVPLFFDNIIYYQNDVAIEGLNLYKTEISNYHSNNILAQIIVQNNQKQNKVLSQEELIEFLRFITDQAGNKAAKSCFELMNSLKYNEGKYELFEICFDNTHNFMSLTFEYQLHESNQQQSKYMTCIKDITNNRYLPAIIENSTGEIVFDDNNGIYFVKQNDSGRSAFLARYDFNETNPEKIELPIIEEADPNFQISVKKTRSNKYLLLESSSLSGEKTNEVYIRGLNSVSESFKLILPRVKGITYQVDHTENYLIVLIHDIIEEKQYVKKIRLENDENLALIAAEKTRSLQINLDKIKSLKEKSDIKVNENSNQTEIVVSRLHGLVEDKRVIKFGELVDFNVLDKNEKIAFFQCFKGYTVFGIKNAENSYLKDKIHTSKFDEPTYSISPETNYRFNTSFFHFELLTPHIPSRIISYNMGLRTNEVIHTDHIVGYNHQDYTLEKIKIPARDGVDIPITLVYNKKRMDSQSPIVFHVEHSKNREFMNFQFERLPLLERGFIYAFPHIRGSLDLNEDWFNEGSGLKKLTSVTDLVDCANFLLENSITPHICLNGKGIGGLVAATAMIKEPNLFSCSVFDDVAFDLIDLLTNNEDATIKKLFGDISDKDIYDHVKSYSPYGMTLSKEIKNLLVFSTADIPLANQSRKFIAKLRELLNDDKNFNRIFFKQYPKLEMNYERIAAMESFFINSIYKKDTLSR